MNFPDHLLHHDRRYALAHAHHVLHLDAKGSGCCQDDVEDQLKYWGIPVGIQRNARRVILLEPANASITSPQDVQPRVLELRVEFLTRGGKLEQGRYRRKVESESQVCSTVLRR